MKHIYDDGQTVFVTEEPPTRANPEQELRNLCGLMAASLSTYEAQVREVMKYTRVPFGCPDEPNDKFPTDDVNRKVSYDRLEGIANALRRDADVLLDQCKTNTNTKRRDNGQH